LREIMMPQHIVREFLSLVLSECSVARSTWTLWKRMIASSNLATQTNSRR
jgi:hypothetical protein